MTIKNLPAWEPSDGPETRKRSIYIFQRRQLELPLLSLFDAPVFQTSCERRAVSTTALQALALTNGDLVNEEVRHFAARLAVQSTDVSGQIRFAFQLALARPPDADELKRALAFVGEEGRDGLVGLCRILLNTSEFAHVD
jgi:hypothetical protein